MSDVDGKPVLIDTLAIVGVGLIGGSFAAALKQAGAVRRVIGAGRRPENLQKAIDLGLSGLTSSICRRTAALLNTGRERVSAAM